jgi:nucleoside-diphosphate-sugar epimerase
MPDKPLILITGANGFVGRAVRKELEKRDFPYRSVVRSGAQDDELALGDFDEGTDWSNVLDGCSTVLHLAARAHVLHETAPDALEKFRKTNVDGTINLARSAARSGVKRFVYVSSIGVNGVSTDGETRFAEDDPPNPHNAYAWSKWEAECALRNIEAETGLEVVIVRPPLVYGAAAPGNFALMVNALKRGMPLPLASIANLRSLIYIDNLTDALILCALHPSASGNLYLVADSEETSTADLTRHLAVEMGVAARLFPFPASLLRLAGRLTGRANTVERLMDSLRIDSAKIRRELGWRPPYTLREGLVITAKELVRNNEKNI